MSVLPSPDTFAAASVNVGHAGERIGGVGRRPGLISRAFTAFRERSRRHAIIGELSTLTDRELADIGLGRGDLPRVFDPEFARGRFVG